jgi:hypothetical protein
VASPLGFTEPLRVTDELETLETLPVTTVGALARAFGEKPSRPTMTTATDKIFVVNFISRVILTYIHNIVKWIKITPILEEMRVFTTDHHGPQYLGSPLMIVPSVSLTTGQNFVLVVGRRTSLSTVDPP